MSAIVLEDRIIHYEVLGRGRPVIFLHGWVGSWRYWIPAMQAVSTGYRTYAIDLYGFGDTAKEPLHYTIDRQAAMIEGFMDKMGMSKVALVGHSLGGLVATLFAWRFPQLVDRLALVSCPLDLSRINSRLRSAAPAELADWLLTRSPLTEPVLTDAPKADPQAIAGSFLQGSARGLNEARYQLSTPCLLVYGQNDPAIGVPDLDTLTDLPERTHPLILDAAGHFPMLDDGSKFNRLLMDFLALPSGENPNQLQLKEEWKRRVR